MTLSEKILTAFPTLTEEDFKPNGTIELRNDGDGDYIAKWDYAEELTDELKTFLK